MYKVEILTIMGSFLAVPEYQQDKNKAAIGYQVADTAENNGYVDLEDGSVVRFKDASIIKGYRVYKEADMAAENLQPTEKRGAAQRPESGAIQAITDTVEYLGQLHGIIIIAAWGEETRKPHFMLYMVGAVPAADALSENGQLAVVTAWLSQRHDYILNGDYVTVLPHGVIDTVDEAIEYVRDYIKETAPEHKPDVTTGKAYTGWNDDRGTTK